MNTNYSDKKLAILLIGGLGLATVVAGAVGMPHRRGTDILHFFARKAMQNQLGTAATGRVDVRQNQQGNANIQTLDITVRTLDKNAAYTLQAVLVDDPNPANPTLQPVDEFTTDAKGNAVLHYREQVTRDGKMHGLGRGKKALPTVVNPLSKVRRLVIAEVDTNTTDTIIPPAILVADLNETNGFQSFQYLIKRDLSTDTVVASLQIIGNLRQTQFRLAASGLTAGASYELRLNGTPMQTVAADAKGRLSIRSWMESALDVLSARSVELWEVGGTAAVLSTQLP